MAFTSPHRPAWSRDAPTAPPILKPILSPRNRELLGLLPAALLVTAGFTAIFIQEQGTSAGAAADVTLNHASSVSLTYGAIFLGLCLAGHLVIRFALPNADPYLFPLGAVLASVGIVMVYRINPTLARQQAQWMVLGLVLFAATILLLRRTGVGVLERYRYTIVAVGIGMTVLPRVPGIGEEVNGAYLNVHVGRRLLPAGGVGEDRAGDLPRQLPARQPPDPRHRRPARARGDAAADEAVRADARGVGRGDGHAAADARARHLVDVLRRLPCAAVRCHRATFLPADRLHPVRCGCVAAGDPRIHVHARVLAWEHPFDPTLYNQKVGGSGQLAQALFAQADGGLLGTGFDRSLVALVPIPESDMIYAVIVNELGLVGAAALLLTYLLFVARGLKIAMLARDSFSKLLATGLSFIVALQVFVIVGGVTRVIPLTGVTLPFVAYGGSSVVMNFVLLALLLVISDRARRPG